MRNKLDYLAQTKRLLRESINGILADRAEPLLTESDPFEAYPSALYAGSPAPSAGSLDGSAADKLLRLNETKVRLREAINVELGIGLTASDPFRSYSNALFEWYMSSVIFGAGEQGAWYDPSDLSTLYQDAAGTTPVAADGDPVGLMLDKSGNGNHASQSVAASRPIYRTDGVLHWLEADGVDDSMLLGFAPTASHSVLIACMATAAGRSIITAGTSRSDLTIRSLDIYEISGDLRYITSDGSTAVVDLLLTQTDITLKTVINASWDGTTDAGGANFSSVGIEAVSGAASTDQIITFNFNLFGSRSSYYFQGNFYGAVIRNTVIDEPGNPESYLANLAGVTL